MPYIGCMPKLLHVDQWRKYAYMPHMNLLASTMQPGALYTDDNDADKDYDTDNDTNGNAASLHWLSWPLTKSAKKKMEIDYDTLKTIKEVKILIKTDACMMFCHEKKPLDLKTNFA